MGGKEERRRRKGGGEEGRRRNGGRENFKGRTQLFSYPNEILPPSFCYFPTIPSHCEPLMKSEPL